MILFASAALAAAPVAAVAPVVAGTWAAEFRVVSAAEVPVIGAVRSTSTSWIRMDVTPDGDGWRVAHEVCDVDVSGRGGRTVIPDAFVTAIPSKSYAADVTATDGGFTWQADVQPFVVGFDPKCGAVPTEADDACVRDFDGDGMPGGTIHAEVPLFPTIELYVAQKSHLVMRGAAQPDGTIAGALVVLDSVTRVLDASVGLFATSPKARAVPGASTFTMVRVADGAGCDAVVDAWN